jgi:hypothetical protein
MENNTEFDKIDSSRWESMSVTELLEQKSIMLNRYFYLSARGVPYAQNLNSGIAQLDNLISSKITG